MKEQIVRKILLVRFVMYKNNYNNLMANENYPFALESASILKEIIYTLYCMDVITKMQYSLLNSKAHKMFWSAYNRIR